MLGAQVEETTEFLADDRLNHERVCQTQRDLIGHLRLGLQPDFRTPVEEIAVGRDLEVDVVAEHVVRGEVVLAVEPAARRQPLRGRVHRDVALLPAIEDRDVLGLRGRARIRNRPEAARTDFRQEIDSARQERPRLASQIAEVQRERLRRLFPKHLFGFAQIPRFDGPPDQQRGIAVGLKRAEAHVGGVESRFEGVCARENPHLALFCVRRRTEAHLAVADEHQAGRALIGVDREHRAFDERQFQILRLEPKVPRIELLCGVEHQVVQILDRRQALLI